MWPAQGDDRGQNGANELINTVIEAADDDNDDDVEMIVNTTHNQQLDFKIRQCLGKQFMRRQGKLDQYPVAEWETQQFAPPAPMDHQREAIDDNQEGLVSEIKNRLMSSLQESFDESIEYKSLTPAMNKMQMYSHD